MKKLLGISLIAMMSVTAANADIASKAYVDTGISTEVTNRNAAITEAVEALDNSGANGGASGFVVSVSEANGVISATAGRVGDAVITGYQEAETAADVEATDTLNAAVGKLQKQIHAAGTASTVAGGNYTAAGQSVSAAIGALDTGLGAKIASDGNFIKDSAENKINENISALDTAIGSLSGFGSQNYAKNTTNVAANLTSLDTQVKANADAISNEVTARQDAIAALDADLSATTGTVVTGITERDGIVTAVATSDPLNVTRYDLVSTAAGTADGKYALTATFANGAITGYKWELISRTGDETVDTYAPAGE